MSHQQCTELTPNSLKDTERKTPLSIQTPKVLPASWSWILNSLRKHTLYLRNLPISGHPQAQDRSILMKHAQTGLSKGCTSTDVLTNVCCNWQSCFLCLQYYCIQNYFHIISLDQDLTGEIEGKKWGECNNLSVKSTSCVSTWSQRSLLPHAVSVRLSFWQRNKTLGAVWRHSNVLLLALATVKAA